PWQPAFSGPAPSIRSSTSVIRSAPTWCSWMGMSVLCLASSQLRPAASIPMPRLPPTAWGGSGRWWGRRFMRLSDPAVDPPRKESPMIYALMLLAAGCRLVPHPPNFTPVLAVALFGGAMLPRRTAWAVPLLAMVASDLALGYRFSWMNAVVYGCFLAAVGIGWWLRHLRTWSRTIAAAFAGSALFYIVTNFAVWLAPPFMYEHTPAG